MVASTVDDLDVVRVGRREHLLESVEDVLVVLDHSDGVHMAMLLEVGDEHVHVLVLLEVEVVELLPE